MVCSRSAARADYSKLRLFWTATGHYNKLNLGIALTGAVSGALMLYAGRRQDPGAPLLRAELRQSLAALWPEGEMAAEAADGYEALRLARAMEPDVAFLDIRMQGLSGLDKGM